MSEDEASDAVLDLLGDEYVRDILAATSDGPKTAKELRDVCGSSLTTVYRRVDELVDRGLLVEGTEIAPDRSHRRVYEARADRVTVTFHDGVLTVDVSVPEDAAERFARIWEDIRRTT